MAAVNAGVNRLIISNPHKAANECKKIVALPIKLKDREVLQFSFYTADKVFHYNLLEDEIEGKLREIEGLGYKQWEIDCGEGSFKLLVGKKGNFKRINIKNPPNFVADLAHNKVKNHILKEGEPLDILINLGLMNKEGTVYKDKQKKFRQINKFLEIVDTVEAYVDDEAHILDFGCGKSYLTFVIYHYFNFILGKNVKITGVDLKEDVVAHCNELAIKCGYENLSFHYGDVSKFEWIKDCNMMVTLHACDTATDFALNYALQNGVKVILSAPCCQHELFGQIKSEVFAPMLKHGILKERFSALLTDAVRGQLLEAMGYRVGIMEFIDMEHTAKNIMIRAVKISDRVDDEKLEAALMLCREFSVEPMLGKLLK
ncbi:MAG: SAM-dependent methyltransferase [Defluviitaleaceae bacterium]|nr:SAM-dependent methyltransferase [Defluviitaleaceae bacterium]